MSLRARTTARRLALGSATIVAAVTGSVALAAGPASAAVYGEYALYAKGGKCLDGGGVGGQPYYINGFCNRSNANQKWYFDGKFGGNGNYGGEFLIKNSATGLCFDGGGGNYTYIYNAVCNRNNPNQLWAEEKSPEPGTSKAVVMYRNKATGLYLDGGGNSPYLRGINDPPNNSALTWYRPTA